MRPKRQIDLIAGKMGWVNGVNYYHEHDDSWLDPSSRDEMAVGDELTPAGAEAVREALENLEEALLQILQWVEAYPDDIFTPLQGDPIKHTGDYDTKEKRTLITRAAAMQGRHVATGIGRIARKALEER